MPFRITVLFHNINSQKEIYCYFLSGFCKKITSVEDWATSYLQHAQSDLPAQRQYLAKRIANKVAERANRSERVVSM